MLDGLLTVPGQATQGHAEHQNAPVAGEDRGLLLAATAQLRARFPPRRRQPPSFTSDSITVPKGELSDEDVVRACLQGDAEAWTTLVHRYGKLVYGIALRSGLPADDSADVSQTVFLTTFRNLHLLERPASLRFWLSMIARREAWHAKRQSTRSVERERQEYGLEIAASEPLPDEEVERLERLFLVQRALERLDERCRQLLELLFFRNPSLSYEDSARALGAPRGSIGPTRARCLEKLRKVLEELGF